MVHSGCANVFGKAVGLFLAKCHELKNLITSRNHVQIADGGLQVLQPYHIVQMS